MRNYTYAYSEDCKKAVAYMEQLFDDPMTQAMHAPTDDIIGSWLRKHVHSCELCKLATIEANMP